MTKNRAKAEGRTRAPTTGAERKTNIVHREGRVKQKVAVFEPLAWQVNPWNDTSPVMLLTGAAGGGKSKLAAEKLHAYLLSYPNATGLVVRKVRATIANSTLLFLQREVMGKDPRIVHRPSDSRFEYFNGSVLAYGGMMNEEQREHIRSVGPHGGVDIAWMEEATQFSEEDFNEIHARMRGNAAPWRQIMLSTNPDAPGHWINVRLILGRQASVYYSRPEDNLYNPGGYLESLGRLTGVQRTRLLEGKWEIGSGRVFDTWADIYEENTLLDNGGSVSLDADYIDGGGPVIWAVDDGYAGEMDATTRMFTGRSHPRAFILLQERPNGQVAVFGEHFAIQLLAQEHIEQVLSMCRENGWPEPEYIVHDRAAQQLGGALQSMGYDTTYDRVPVEESTKETREWLAADENGFRRIIVHPRCFYLRYQMSTYSYHDRGGVIKEHDDGPDALRYYVWSQSYGTGGIGVDIVAWSDVLLNQYEQQAS